MPWRVKLTALANSRKNVMPRTSILQQLQSGLLNFDAAFDSIAGRGNPSARTQQGTLAYAHPEDRPAPVAASAQVSATFAARTQSGKVELTAPSEVPQSQGLPIRALPLTLLSVDDKRIWSGEPVATTQGAVPADTARVLRPSNGGDVVHAELVGDGVALVTMCDEAHRNMFSEGLVNGLHEIFAELGAREEVRAVVVQGYGTWFCSGGTPNSLASIQLGDSSFLDNPIFRLLLDCPLPTVAAMGGHALGGGLTFGLYADLLVLSSSAYYAANFMDHGFTPGVGATFLFPHKLGPVLGTEMLLTAQRYQGYELKARGAPVQVVARDEVRDRALEIASRLATKPRLQLVYLKRHLSGPVRQALTTVMQREQGMHDAVFADVRRKVVLSNSCS